MKNIALRVALRCFVLLFFVLLGGWKALNMAPGV